MRSKRRIGILPDLVARPLFLRFREPGFDVVRDVPGALALKLRERRLDGAFLSPIAAETDLFACPAAEGSAGAGAITYGFDDEARSGIALPDPVCIPVERFLFFSTASRG
ncbi:MAG TPA: hypothetical protein VI932_01565 [Bacteroidota bacterium]|nr:hypothetical protein [Bacteroidota bacterium]